MSTLRVSNIEAKADASSPTIDEKVKVTSSQGRVLVQIDGKNTGITSVGINTTGTTFTIDGNNNVQFVGVITAANVNTTGVSTFTSLSVTGNLGIGNTNPGAKLDVTGDIRLSGDDPEIEFNNGGARIKGRMNALSIHSGSGFNSDSEERVRINSTGVGIGTTNPATQLHVNGGLFRVDSGGYGGIILGDNSSNSFHITKETSDNSFGIWSGTVGSGTNRLKIDSSGRVLNSSAQPYFYAKGPESSTTLTNTADLNFNNAIINNGNYYNTSTYRFTVPVGGRYLFTWSVFINTATGRCTLKVNGSSYNNLQMDVGGAMSQSVILQLSPNDYVSVGDWQSISGGAFYMGHSHFSGILLG